MKKKIGLVIQGPLISKGRTGDKMHQTPEQLRAEGGLVEYDCRSNINRIIKEFGHLFDYIVISTEFNHLREGDVFPGAEIVLGSDPGGIKQEGHYKDNNKFRQFLSTHRGLVELEKRGIEIVVKTRTDIYLDFNKLIESYFIQINDKKNKKAIGATVVHPATFLLHDLYFISSLTALKEFCESILGFDRFEFIPSVHREMILKHAYKEYKEKINVPDWAYFPISPPNGINAKTRAIFDYMFENVYFDLDPKIFENTLWRGTYFEREHVTFLTQSKTARRVYNIPAFLSIDWDRYFYFKLQTEGREITFLDKAKVKIGRLGWNIWNLIRKLGRKVLSVVR